MVLPSQFNYTIRIKHDVHLPVELEITPVISVLLTYLNATLHSDYTNPIQYQH